MDMNLRRFVVWFSSLIVFLCPHPLWRELDAKVFHRPWFLIIVPLVLAWLTPYFAGNRVLLWLFRKPQPSRRSVEWNSITSCMIVILLLGVPLYFIDRSHAAGTLWLNITFGVTIVVALGTIWYRARQLRGETPPDEL